MRTCRVEYVPCGGREVWGGVESGPVQMLLMCSGYDEILLFISSVYIAE